MEQLDRIEAKLDQLLGGVDNTRPPLVGPGVVVIDGAAINLAEPLRSDWQAPMMSRELTRYGRVGSDPSNAPEGYPRRSPMGYPLLYPLGAGVGTPRVIFGESTFADDGEVMAWRAAAAQRDMNSAGYR